jgi:phenylpropionate dioxygenase-like ring-hydroxylating dioxygenase large terminal subunit
MSAWPLSMRKQWFVAAHAEKVGKRPLAVTVLDVPLVLGRSADGAVFVFEDRCPHRQVPLSCGRMTEHGLQCPYHGWTFGGDGKLTVMPGLAPDQPTPAIKARSVRCVERNGMVWVQLLAPEPSDASALDAPPTAMTNGLQGSISQPWQASWKTGIVDAIENFLDPLHTHTLHPGLVRRDGRRLPVQAAVRLTAEGFRVDYRGQAEQSGWLYRLFESPRISECAVFAGASSARIEYRYQNGSAIDITLHFTPASSNETHVFGSMAVAGRWAPRWALYLFVLPFLSKVGRQDQRMVELQAANRARFADQGSVSTELDLVRPYVAALWQGAPFSPEGFERDVVLYL